MAAEKTEKAQQATFAEGIPVPTTIGPQPAPVPTAADVAKEWGTYKAKYPLYVGTARAFNAGDPVNASHPYLQPGEHGEGWLAEEAVEILQ